MNLALEPSPHTVYRRGTPLPGLYALKLICALFVVIIHMNDYLHFGPYMPLLRLAVPCFFMITGYFLPDDDGRLNPQRLLRSARKILVLYLAGSAVYMLAEFGHFLTGVPCAYDELPTAMGLAKFVFAGTLFAGPYWYLCASAYALAVLYFLVRCRVEKLIFLLAPLLIAIPLIFDAYISFFPIDRFHFFLTHNAMTPALPYFAAGILMRRHEGIIKARGKISALFSAGMVIATVEWLLLPSEQPNDIFIGTVIAAPSLMLLILSLPFPDTLLPLAKAGSRLATPIYLWHALIITEVLAFFQMPAWASAAAITVLCVMVASVHAWLKSTNPRFARLF